VEPAHFEAEGVVAPGCGGALMEFHERFGSKMMLDNLMQIG